MFLGAVAQSVPDIDFVAGFWSSPSENLLAHRGFTHSFLFLFLITPLLAMLAEKWHRPHDISLKKWILFFGIQGLIHLLIDGMNVYGVGWFEPFSHVRVSYNWIFVADPFFSIWPGLAFLLLLILRKGKPVRRRLAWYGIALSGIYLAYCGFNKYKIDRDVREILNRQGISYQRYFTTPTPLNNWLWYVVAGNDSGYYIGYRSLFDREKKISFQYIRRNENWLIPFREHEDLQRLIRFSKDYYTVSRLDGRFVFNDIRFGQVIGWRDPDAPFVFYYFLQDPAENKFLVQRGRFARWNRNAVVSLINRIKGQ